LKLQMTHLHIPWKTQMQVWKWKQQQKNELGLCSLVRNTLEVRKACWSFWMEIKASDKRVNYSHELAQNKQQVD